MAAQYDIIIVGAGPAGATCTLALKKSGLRVLLIDKATFPRDKVCGDAVSSVPKRVLRSIDPAVERDLDAFGPKSNVNSVRMYAPDFTSLTIRASTVSHCIPRYRFDDWLFRHATNGNPTLEVRVGDAVRTIARGPEGITVSVGPGEIYTSDLVIACDGANSIVGRTLSGYVLDRRHHSGAVRQYFRAVGGLQPDTTEVYFLEGYLPGYFWIFPVGEEMANVGFGMLSSVISDRRIDLRKSMASIIRDIPEIAARFRDAVPVDVAQGCGLPMGSKLPVLSGDRYLLCGDAAALIDPFSGEGIPSAMESGLFAAETAMEAHRARRFDAAFLDRYTQKVLARYQRPFRDHYLMQRAFSERPWLFNGLFRLGNIPFINRRLAQWFY